MAPEAATLLLAAPAATAAPAAPAETPGQAARRRMHEAGQARHAALLLSTRVQALSDRADRQSDGFTGREGYTAWQALTRDDIRDTLDGETVTLTLRTLAPTKRGMRCTVSGLTDAAGHVVAIRGECTVVDIADPRSLDGVTVAVRLTARRGESKNGTPFTGFTGESVGLASHGVRVGVKARVQAARHVRVAASSLV